MLEKLIFPLFSIKSKTQNCDFCSIKILLKIYKSVFFGTENYPRDIEGENLNYRNSDISIKSNLEDSDIVCLLRDKPEYQIQSWRRMSLHAILCIFNSAPSACMTCSNTQTNQQERVNTYVELYTSRDSFPAHISHLSAYFTFIVFIAENGHLVSDQLYSLLKSTKISAFLFSVSVFSSSFSLCLFNYIFLKLLFFTSIFSS